MKATSKILFLALLCAISATAFAQVVPTGTTAEGGRTGTGTGEMTTEQTIAPAPPSSDTDASRTGGGTGTLIATVAEPAITMTTSVATLYAPGGLTLTLAMAGDATATEETTASYVAPLTSSEPACTVPSEVKLAWSSSTGASATAVVSCSKVNSNRTVTITSGTTTVSFALKR